MNRKGPPLILQIGNPNSSSTDKIPQKLVAPPHQPTKKKIFKLCRILSVFGLCVILSLRDFVATRLIFRLRRWRYIPHQRIYQQSIGPIGRGGLSFKDAKLLNTIYCSGYYLFIYHYTFCKIHNPTIFGVIIEV